MRTYKIKKVLVPIDFSNVSLNALESALMICKRQKASLTILFVLENPYALLPPEFGVPVDILALNLEQRTNDELEKLIADLVLKYEVEIKQAIRSGNPADEICKLASEKNFDLVVMGTHGATGLREFFLGSNAYRVVKNSTCPVMTIPVSNSWLEFKKILFPIRMVPHALDKYDLVRPIIHKNGSALVIAGVVKKDDPIGTLEIQDLVNTVQSKIEDDRVICTSEVHYCENVAKQVLAIASLKKPDLIVITATLDMSLTDYFLGSYTQDIVNHASFPVLSIRPEVSEKTLTVLTTLVHNERPHSALFTD